MSVHHSELPLSSELIQDTFTVNEWSSAHSFSWNDFQVFASHVHSLDDSKTNAITVDDESKSIADLVNAIAEQTELQAGSSIHLRTRKN